MKVDGVRMAMEEVKTDLPEGVDSPDIVIQAMGLAVDSEVYVLCRALPRPTATSCQCHPMTFGISAFDLI